MDRDLAVAVSKAPRCDVNAIFERHVSPNRVDRALLGSASGGRWAARDTFHVIYLGRPATSVIVEAHRHLVDDIDGMTPERVRGRRLVRAQVTVREVLDLRTPAARVAVGLSEAELLSKVGDYEACHRVGHVAHQLGLHGVLAPSATRLGETLALFVDLLAVEELPVAVGPPEVWDALPPDPRRLRVVDDGRSSG